jgi:aldose 1-epimerase
MSIPSRYLDDAAFLEAGPARAVVLPSLGARLGSLTVDGLELLGGDGDSPIHWGLYPMAPWAGRVRHGVFDFAGERRHLPLTMPPHAIHGTVLDVAWTRTSDTRFEVDLVPPWPWAGRVVQEVTLTPEALSLRLEVSTADGPMPAECGWHPWWKRRLDRGEDVQVELAARAMYVRDSAGIPTGERIGPPAGPYDDCFTDFDQPVMLRWPGALTLSMDTTCDHLVLYDQPRSAVCVEPQTGPPDALNLGAHVVEPGTPLVAEARWVWAIS